ncbi:MAG: hypothetical protein AAF415_02235 [Pseudomonadota bacterium]
MITYSNVVDGVPFTWNFEGEVVSVGPSIDRVLADTWQRAARDAEASAPGIAFPKIIDAEGRTILEQGITETDLTVTFLRGWLILTEKIAGTFSVGGGNVVSETYGVDIFALNPLVTTQNNTSSSGTRVSTGGSSLTSEEAALLTRIGEIVEADEVLTEVRAQKLRKGTDTVLVDKDVTLGPGSRDVALRDRT